MAYVSFWLTSRDFELQQPSSSRIGLTLSLSFFANYVIVVNNWKQLTIRNKPTNNNRVFTKKSRKQKYISALFVFENRFLIDLRFSFGITFKVLFIRTKCGNFKNSILGEFQSSRLINVHRPPICLGSTY